MREQLVEQVFPGAKATITGWLDVAFAAYPTLTVVGIFLAIILLLLIKVRLSVFMIRRSVRRMRGHSTK